MYFLLCIIRMSSLDNKLWDNGYGKAGCMIEGGANNCIPIVRFVQALRGMVTIVITGSRKTNLRFAQLVKLAQGNIFGAEECFAASTCRDYPRLHGCRVGSSDPAGRVPRWALLKNA